MYPTLSHPHPPSAHHSFTPCTMFSHLISYAESHEFFQAELLLLLVSLIVSFLFTNPFPYFVASALCLLAAASTLIFELFGHITGQYAYLEATTTLTFAVILSGTFVYAVVRRLPSVELRWHTVTTLGFWAYLALRAVWILEDTARPIHLEVSWERLCTLLLCSHPLVRSTSVALKPLDSLPCT